MVLPLQVAMVDPFLEDVPLFYGEWNDREGKAYEFSPGDGLQGYQSPVSIELYKKNYRDSTQEHLSVHPRSARR